MKYLPSIHLAIIALLLLAPSNGVFAEEIDRVMAKVNDDIIMLSDLRQEMYGEILATKSPTDAADAVLQKLDAMIDKVLLLQEAERRKIEISDDKVNKSVNTSIEILRSGYSSEENFLEALGDNKIDLEKLERSLFKRYRKSYIVHALVASGFIVTDNDAEVYERQQRALNRPAITYQIAHILLRLPQSPKPTDIARVMARAYDILAELHKDKSFGELALEYSDDMYTKQNGGEMGFVADTELVEPILDAVKNLKVGDVSLPVRTEQGFHLIKLIDRLSPRRQLYEQRFLEEKSQLVEQLRRKAAIKVFVGD